jgi:hypothetical protein
VVPLAAQQACVDALRACGGTVEFIVYPGVGHDAWNPAYEDPALVPWLMRQRLPAPRHLNRVPPRPEPDPLRHRPCTPLRSASGLQAAAVCRTAACSAWTATA